MPYIKKLVMKGFKSFAKETEIPFSNSMNSIVGPNGSGKSNIIDALCFVLGRLSIKSMRAAKSANLIFAGTKEHKSVSEASVKLIFDNSDKKFPLDKKEIIIERIARQNGQGIYKINSETKTRQEVLELLATAGIDPYGFNIILQGEIDSLVKMHSEDRRKIIEEVAGISIYELRKEKSLHELEKTEERLKEISTTLRERTLYLKNLEEERKQALKFKKLEELEKKYKASIIKKKLDEKQKEISIIEKNKEQKSKIEAEIKEKTEKIQEKINETEQEISKINSIIQKASGIERDALNTEISDIRAELAGLDVQKSNNEERISEFATKRGKLEEDIKKLEEEISRLRKEFPSQAKKYQELENKKKELEEIEKFRKNFYNLNARLNSIKEKVEDKKLLSQKSKTEIDFILKETEKISQNLLYKEIEICKREIINLKNIYEKEIKNLKIKEQEFLEKEKLISVYNSEISNSEKIKKQVSSLDICPLCKSKITSEHIKEVFKECDSKITEFQKKINELTIENIKKELEKLKQELEITKNKISKADSDFLILKNIEDKKEQIKKLFSEKKQLESEISTFDKERKNLEIKILEFKGIEEKYDKAFIELQEISARTQENLNAELEFKERNLQQTRNLIKQNEREEYELKLDLEEIKKDIETKEQELEKKELQEQELEKKFQKLIEKKTSFEKEIHENNIIMFEFRNRISLVESEINNLKIEIARLDAEKQNLEIDFSSYKEIEIINISLNALELKLAEAQVELQNIGSVNLRALEVYDNMKKEYDVIAEKVTVLEKEKLEILKIIEEIDRKKKKTFIRTLEAINQLFNRNFIQLSTKGSAFLEPENPDDPFSAGLDIIIKVGKGKYFDVTSLSGGEQTLVALSLIFAIQEYKPYSFYIFDEVDAALDKRNSERLASLIKRYMKTGQYIIITHNDAIITESTILYGVSMQEGISKILSLEI